MQKVFAGSVAHCLFQRIAQDPSLDMCHFGSGSQYLGKWGRECGGQCLA